MKRKKYIKSIEEFEKTYFPEAYKKQVQKESSPQELGALWAKETINNLKEKYKSLFNE